MALTIKDDTILIFGGSAFHSYAPLDNHCLVVSKRVGNVLDEFSLSSEQTLSEKRSIRTCQGTLQLNKALQALKLPLNISACVHSSESRPVSRGSRTHRPKTSRNPNEIRKKDVSHVFHTLATPRKASAQTSCLGLPRIFRGTSISCSPKEIPARSRKPSIQSSRPHTAVSETMTVNFTPRSQSQLMHRSHSPYSSPDSQSKVCVAYPQPLSSRHSGKLYMLENGQGQFSRLVPITSMQQHSSKNSSIHLWQHASDIQRTLEPRPPSIPRKRPKS